MHFVVMLIVAVVLGGAAWVVSPGTGNAETAGWSITGGPGPGGISGPAMSMQLSQSGFQAGPLLAPNAHLNCRIVRGPRICRPRIDCPRLLLVGCPDGGSIVLQADGWLRCQKLVCGP